MAWRTSAGEEKTDPLVSIIIPTYNRCSLLVEAIASVESQTYRNWELIISDDGSTDDTLATIEKIAEPRIRVLSLPHTGHIGKVMNAGAQLSKGEWLAFHNSDDVWLPRKLELQFKTLQKEKKRWIYGGYELMDENKITIHRPTLKFIPYRGMMVKEIIQTKTAITICSILMEKKLFDEIGGFCEDPRLLYRGDFEFTLRLAMQAEAAVVREIVLRVREHAGRVTRSLSDGNERSALAYEIFINQKPGKELETLARKQLAYELSEASINRFAQGRIKLALKQLSRAFFLRDNFRHWLSAIKRGIYAIFKKRFIHSAKKRKT